MTDRIHYYVDLNMLRERLEDGEYAPADDRVIVEPGDPFGEPNVVSSELAGTGLGTNALHAPALDIDIPCRYVESSTPGHGHLYFDSLKLTWRSYAKLLLALHEAGIIETGYLEASLERGATFLRMPGVKK